MKTIVYIAGKYTDSTGWHIRQNIHAAECAAAELIAQGCTFPITPHSIGANFHGFGTPAYWYEGTLALMLRSDAVLALPSWQNSQGAELEVQVAERAGLPVFYDISEFFRWSRGQAVGTRNGQRGALGDLLAGLPQTLPLREAQSGREQEVRAWRREADDGMIYELSMIGGERMKLVSAHGDVVFEQPEILRLFCGHCGHSDPSVLAIGARSVCLHCVRITEESREGTAAAISGFGNCAGCRSITEVKAFSAHARFCQPCSLKNCPDCGEIGSVAPVADREHEYVCKRCGSSWTFTELGERDKGQAHG